MGEALTVDGVTYRCMTGAEAPDELVILKPRHEVDVLVRLVQDLRPRRIMELGIYAGGSTALLAQLARPERLVALDLRSEPCEPLEPFIDRHHLRDTVSAHYGVDQADTAALDALVKLFDGPLDLVIDDASHLEPQTRASFNHLFPHLRPGGRYVIEDWPWAHRGVTHHDPGYQGVTPLSTLVCELVVVAASRPRMITAVEVDANTAVVHRGPADLRPGIFDVSNMLDVVGRDMVDRMREARTLRACP
jgi:predicted O-methyltransferase YrrM